MSADKGDTQSMLRYALMLNDGDGVNVDRNEAARYLKMAADQGNPDAIEACTLYGCSIQ